MEDIKKRWWEYTEELYKKDLHDPDNQGGVVTHLEPDILECKVKWTLGRITTNKTRRGDGILAKLFQILKMMLLMCCTQYARKLSPCIFDLYTEYKVQNARLNESPAGIKTAGSDINNLRYTDETTLMAESEEELKSLLTKVKQESEKVGLNLNIQKTKIMASGPITS